MTDPISDMLTRVRNAYLAKKPEVLLPHSRFKHSLADLLVTHGWLSAAAVAAGSEDDKVKKQLRLTLKYSASGEPAVSELTRVSKPGQRIYAGTGKLSKFGRGMQATTIVSTSQGLMTGKQAKAKKVGGEILCQIW